MDDRDSRFPGGWGSDPLSDFLKQAEANTFGTYVQYQGAFSLLAHIDQAFRKAIECLHNAVPVQPGFFLLRTHACYLAAVRLAVATQTFECQPVLRICLEASLYGLYISHNPQDWQVWVERHKDDDALKAMKNTFKVGKMFKCLSRIDGGLHKVVQTLYDQTINLGGHPNPVGILASMEISSDDHAWHMDANYLTDNPTPIKLAIKTTARVGVASLKIFSHVYPDRFTKVGLDDTIDQLSSGL